MADTPQNQQQEKKEEGFSLFKPKEWSGFLWNIFWRLPGLERFRVGRVKVGGRPHPIENELRETWLKKNDQLFLGPLETIEKTWDGESFLLGLNKNNKDALILGNPDGIVPLYVQLGAYADIDRIVVERDWFQFGTGFEEETMPFELPKDNEIERLQWDKNVLRELKLKKTEPWKNVKVRRYKLNSGVVFHEGKQEFKEELYCFGFQRFKAFSESLSKIAKEVTLENMRNKKVQVEIRTRITNSVDQLTGVLKHIAEIEEKMYNMLRTATFNIETYEKLWDKIVKDHSPEKKDIIMRFPHSYRIVKIYHNEKLDDVKVKKVDDNGNIAEDTFKERKLVYFDPDQNSFKREFDEINADIQRLGGETALKREAEESEAQARQLIQQANQIDAQIRPFIPKALKEGFTKKLILRLNGKLEVTLRGSEDLIKEFRKNIVAKIRILKRIEYDKKISELFDLLRQKLQETGINDNELNKALNQIKIKLKQKDTINQKIKLLVDVGDLLKMSVTYSGITNNIKEKVRDPNTDINELFDLINEKLKEAEINANKVKGDIINFKRQINRDNKDGKSKILVSLYRYVAEILNKQSNILDEKYSIINNSFNNKRKELKEIIEEDTPNKDELYKDYNIKINEFFGFINAKFKELKIVIDKELSKHIEDLKRILKQQPYGLDKQITLMELYNNLTTIIKNNYNSQREILRNFFIGISNKVNELAVFSGDEFNNKKKELFSIISDRLIFNTFSEELLAGIEIKSGIEIESIRKKLELEEDKIEDKILKQAKKRMKEIKDQMELPEEEITDSKIKRLSKFIEQVKVDFELALKTKEIMRLLESKEAILSRKRRLMERRKELLEKVFKKERLKFYDDHLTPKNPRYHKRREEVAYGLDENGYPLEIDDEDGTITGTPGTVLIDFWWNQLAQNDWQLKTIAKKPGGAELLKTHLGLDVKFGQTPGKEPKDDDITIKGALNQRTIRYVDDKKFYGKVDLLDAATILFGVWDEVRDDLRDGRYHKHSKSVGDYVIEGMGGFDEELAAPYLKRSITYGTISKGLFITRRGIISTESAALKIDLRDLKVLRDSKPSDFENTKDHPNTIPKEEDLISRKFKFRIPEGVSLPTKYLRDNIIKTSNGNFLIGERRPTKYNPGFDRRAETFHFMHWGKMYYYRWSGYTTEWSENPFPHISTRGIALYIAFLTASDVWYYKEGEDALKGHKFDYGVRGQLKFGYNNPLSGDYILQEN